MCANRIWWTIKSLNNLPFNSRSLTPISRLCPRVDYLQKAMLISSTSCNCRNGKIPQNYIQPSGEPSCKTVATLSFFLLLALGVGCRLIKIFISLKLAPIAIELFVGSGSCLILWYFNLLVKYRKKRGAAMASYLPDFIVPLKNVRIIRVFVFEMSTKLQMASVPISKIMRHLRIASACALKIK